MIVFDPGASRAGGTGHAKQRGFSLVEILITAIVLSVGLLGLAGLQAFSLKDNNVAYYRSIASQQAYDMQDRIRANLAGVLTGSYDNLTATLPSSPADCFSSSCSAADMATVDQFQWLTSTAALLPGGQGTVLCCTQGSGVAGTCVCNPAASNRIYEITVMWREKDTGDTGSTASDPNCPASTAANTRCFVTRFSP